MAQPKLTDLMSRFLNNQIAAEGAGLGMVEAGEVLPYQASAVQPVSPQAAWDAATAVLAFYDPKAKAKASASWAQLVATHEPEVAIAFCAGNFPQLVRSFHTLIHQTKLSDLRPAAGRMNQAIDSSKPTTFPEVLTAAGCLRLANDFETAEKLLNEAEKNVPAAWRAALENERAALAWHQGRSEEALKMWNRQADSVPALFNRGMAALFMGRTADATEPLTKAVKQLPETSPWHHLGRLYLILAEQRN